MALDFFYISRYEIVCEEIDNEISLKLIMMIMWMMLMIYFLSAQRSNSSGMGVSSQMWIIISVSFLLATAAGFALFTLRSKIMGKWKGKGATQNLS